MQYAGASVIFKIKRIRSDIDSNLIRSSANEVNAIPNELTKCFFIVSPWIRLKGCGMSSLVLIGTGVLETKPKFEEFRDSSRTTNNQKPQ